MTSDFLTDHNPVAIFTADNLKELPAWATSLPMSKEAYAHLDAGLCFADPGRRLFPINSKAAAFLSNLYYTGSGGAPDTPVARRLQKAAGVFGLEGELQPYFEGFRDIMEKAAAVVEPAVTHALRVEDADGTVTGYYPVVSSDDIVKSAHRLKDDLSLGSIPVEWYTKAAAVIVDQARTAGCTDDIPASVMAAGEPRTFDKSAAKQALVSRLRVGDVDMTAWNLYSELVKAADTAATREEQVKLAEAMFTIDSRCSVRYNRHVPDPFEMFFGAGESLHPDDLRKKAASTVELNNILIPVTDFATHGLPILAKFFGKTAAVESTPEPVEGNAGLDQSLERAAKIQGMIDSLDPTERNELLTRLVETYRKIKPVTDAPLPLPV